MKKKFLLLVTFAILNFAVKADEGMWLALLLKQNYETMKKMGLKLTPEQIFDLNKNSLKDAIIALDGGSCTAEIISPEGLLLTNHHCGFGEIQAHSSPEHDYLVNGFWAMSKKDELANPGKTASILVSVEDVTETINSKLTDDMDEKTRMMTISGISADLEKKATDGNHYKANVQSMFKGNQFFLFVYEIFRDVRLVGAPPSAIGKFGGDTDNWMWPRHTGDFSMFRIYADKDNKPADYSADNVPYKPKHFLPVSTKGVENEDFAMIMGYPGSTSRYLTSWGIEENVETNNPIRIKVRTEKQRIMKEDMEKSDKVRIQYASKYSRSSNYWKYSIGQNKGLKALNVFGKKQQIENKFKTWMSNDKKRKEKYGASLKLLEEAYMEKKELNKTQQYIMECIFSGPEIVMFAYSASSLAYLLKEKPDEKETIKATIEEMKAAGKAYFKDYNAPTDKKILASLFKMFSENVKKGHQPDIFNKIQKKYKGNFNKFADKMFDKSFFVSEEKFNDFLKNPKLKTIEKDLAYQTMKSIIDKYRELGPKLAPIQAKMSKGNRLFVGGLLEMEKDKAHYPDANSTMRLTYGKVGDYDPRDGVHYKSFTTLKGYFEKEVKNVKATHEFFVPNKLKKLYENKDYGKWADKDGLMRVCFTTDNDITGGNSGSPVINGNGELIGCAFDGNWEAMSGDIAFETELQKCINVDIRYVLFVIDKYAGAGHLIEEMKIVK